MNYLDMSDAALIEASRMQREALARMGETFASMYPEETISLRHFIRTNEKTKFYKESKS